jgi:hypothetical protein
MKYELLDQQTKSVKQMTFEGLKAKLQSWNQDWTKENIERLWQIELGETVFIMGHQIKRIV